MPSPSHTGWKNCAANARLLAQYGGTTVFYIDANGLVSSLSQSFSGGVVIPSGQVINFDAAAGSAADLITDVNDNELLATWAVACAVNELQLRNAAACNPPQIVSQGGDTNVGLQLTTKAAGALFVSLGGDSNFALHDIATSPLTVSAAGVGDPTYFHFQGGAAASACGAGSAGALYVVRAGVGGGGHACDQAGGVGGAGTIAAGTGGLAVACSTGNGGAGGVMSLFGGIGGAGGSGACSDGGSGGNLIIGPGAGGANGGAGCAGADGAILLQASDGGLGTAVASECTNSWTVSNATVGAVQHTTAWAACDTTAANTGVLLIRIS